MKFLKRSVMMLQVILLILSLVEIRTEKYAMVESGPTGIATWVVVHTYDNPMSWTTLHDGDEPVKMVTPGYTMRRVEATWLRTHIEPTTHLAYIGIRDVRNWKPDLTMAVLAAGSVTKRHELRVLAVSAPYWPRRAVDNRNALGSRVPFSLQNACRLAAGTALSRQGVWGDSNWSERDSLNANVVMYDYADDLHLLEQQLAQIRPNFLLIGAMTLALPGAIEIARMAKDMLGDDVTVVLGGKHTSETIYQQHGHVRHNPASPLRLMSEGRISQNFDIVVAGDGEYVVAELGEMVARYGTAPRVAAHLDELRDCPGNWIAGAASDGVVTTIGSSGQPIDYASLPVPAEVFGFHGVFPIFDTDRTAHVYSDISRGCMYDCFFCTEKRSVNGQPRLQGAAVRLARQFAAVRAAGKAAADRVSAFVEDSILLMGNVRELRLLRQSLDLYPPISFGGQTTVPLFLRKDVRQELIALKHHGLCYLYAGMETADEGVAVTMSKNIGNGGDWLSRSKEVVRLATEAGLKYGIATMFGLGESQATRVRQLEEILRWQRTYNGNPRCVSLNWATQHPLLNVGTSDYVEWGTPGDSELLPYFQTLFGEASEKYLVHPKKPTVAELEELRQLAAELQLQQ